MKKLKSESGSALILALFIMILVSIIIVSFSNQVANQIRSTINLDKDIQEMYDAESNIEKCIKDFIEGIEIEYKDNIYKKQTVNIDGKDTVKYDKYFYYNIKFSRPNTDYKLELSNDIKNDESNMISIFQQKIERVDNIDNTDNDIIIIEENDDEPKFDSADASKGIIFTMKLIENDNKESQIDIKVDNIKVNDGKVVCNIDYSVVSWRIRN